jgi:hypothetical protein
VLLSEYWQIQQLHHLLQQQQIGPVEIPGGDLLIHPDARYCHIELILEMTPPAISLFLQYRLVEYF